jgi:hypothetical protein
MNVLLVGTDRSFAKNAKISKLEDALIRNRGNLRF